MHNWISLHEDCFYTIAIAHFAVVLTWSLPVGFIKKQQLLMKAIKSSGSYGPHTGDVDIFYKNKIKRRLLASYTVLIELKPGMCPIECDTRLYSIHVWLLCPCVLKEVLVNGREVNNSVIWPHFIQKIYLPYKSLRMVLLRVGKDCYAGT